MTVRSYFPVLRKKLDDAITFGLRTTARRLAREGLRLAEMKELLSEMAYFSAQIAIINEDYGLAITHLDRAIRLNPNDGASFNDRAICMVELGDIEGAFFSLDRGIEVEPDYANVYHNKGWLLLKTGRRQEAIPYFMMALALEPDRAVTYENLAHAYEKGGDLERALEAFTTAIQYVPRRCGAIRRGLAIKCALLKERIEGRGRG